MLQLSALAALAAFSAPGAVARADSWPGPVVTEAFSKSRDWFGRITPGKSIGDTFGFAGSPKGPYATAEFYRRHADRSYRLVAEKTLLNPVAPIVFFVTDRGYLATLDNWHNVGYGKIAAFYTPEGEPIKSFTLTDLFSSDELERFSKSVSSELIFEIETGAWQFCQPRGRLHQCRATNTDRKWQAFVEPKPRS